MGRGEGERGRDREGGKEREGERDREFESYKRAMVLKKTFPKRFLRRVYKN